MARVKQNKYEIFTEDEIKAILEEDINEISSNKSKTYKYYINLGFNAGIRLQDAEKNLKTVSGKEKGQLEKDIQKYARQLWEANYNLVKVLTDSSIKILFFYSKDANSEFFEGSYLDENFINKVLKYSPSKGFEFSISDSKTIGLQQKENYSIPEKAKKLYEYAAWVLSSAHKDEPNAKTNNEIGITLKYTNHWKVITTRKKQRRRVYEFNVNYDNATNDTLGMYFYRSNKKNVPGYYYYLGNDINNRIATNYGWIREHSLEYCKNTKDNNKVDKTGVRSILSSKTDTEEGYKKGDVDEYQVKGLNTKLMSKESVNNLIAMFKFLKKNENNLSETSIKDIFYKDGSKALKYIVSHINKKQEETIEELIEYVIPKEKS